MSLLFGIGAAGSGKAITNSGNIGGVTSAVCLDGASNTVGLLKCGIFESTLVTGNKPNTMIIRHGRRLRVPDALTLEARAAPCWKF